jgi:glycosyltransferase involved in cell wall biosynthesis
MKVESRGLGSFVRLLGDVPHEACLAVLARSALMVRPTFADGDAISVREALALGVPVVASDAAPRPAGTLVFQTGSLEGLVGAIEGALCGARAAQGAAESPAARIDQLLKIYAQAAH